MDYVAKLVCSPFVRVELVQPSHKYFHINECLGRKNLFKLWLPCLSRSRSVQKQTRSQRAVLPASRSQRWLEFVLQVTNIVDLLAILPWWLDLCFVKILPGAAFLRIIRISRIFHLFKSARYFDMVQVLGLTLWKSINLVGIVFALITVVGLFAACLLQQAEVVMGSDMSEVFQTVPASWFWIFCRLIGMKDTSYGKGIVQSYLGIAVLAITLTLKGVLWIVPIARIRQIFSQEYALVVNSSKARRKIIADLLAYVAGSDQSHMQSRYGYTSANLILYSKGEDLKAWVPLPIHQSQVGRAAGSDTASFLHAGCSGPACLQDVKIEDFRVTVGSDEAAAEVQLEILWEPSAWA